MKKNELVKQEEGSAVVEAANTVDTQAWGDTDVSTDDLILPKILLMQGLSELVAQGDAKMGDIINSLTSTVVGDEKKPVALLPFYCRKSWVIEKWDGSKFQYEKSIPDIGEKLPYDEEINGVKYKNSHQYEFFCLTEDKSIPHILTFRGKSHKTGKQLFTQMYVINKSLAKTPAAYWINLGCNRDKNDKGTFMVWSFKPTHESTQQDITDCLKWIPIVSIAVVKPTVETRQESNVF
jgi:hypothetical protein